jgi:hypothetical protein
MDAPIHVGFQFPDLRRPAMALTRPPSPNLGAAGGRPFSRKSCTSLRNPPEKLNGPRFEIITKSLIDVSFHDHCTRLHTFQKISETASRIVTFMITARFMSGLWGRYCIFFKIRQYGPCRPKHGIVKLWDGDGSTPGWDLDDETVQQPRQAKMDRENGNKDAYLVSERKVGIFSRSRKAKIITTGIHRSISRTYPPQAGYKLSLSKRSVDPAHRGRRERLGEITVFGRTLAKRARTECQVQVWNSFSLTNPGNAAVE